MTPLLWACIHCNVILVRLLLESAQRCHVPLTTLTRTTNRFGASPLMLAFSAAPMRCFEAEKYVAPVSGKCESRADFSADAPDDKSGGALPSAAASAAAIALGTEVSALNPATVLALARSASCEKLRSLSCRLTKWGARPTSVEKQAILRQACTIVSLMLSVERADVHRAAMLIFASKREECSKWTPLHFGARSAVLSFFDWGCLGDQVDELDLNPPARSGVTPLQLAAWNGMASTLASVLGPWPAGVENRVAPRMRLNDRLAFGASTRPHPLSAQGLTELDLAVLKQHVHSARLLCRAGGQMIACTGSRGAEELLFRSLLLCDGITTEKLLFSDAFELKVGLLPDSLECLLYAPFPSSMRDAGDVRDA